MELKRRLIIVFTFLLISVNIIQFIVVWTITGNATGLSSVCINTPPDLTAIIDQTATVNEAFTLQINATDNNSGQTLTYLDNTSIFNINSSGAISFTPSSSDAGNHSILISVQDDSGCANSNVSDDFYLNISAVSCNNTEPSITTIPDQSATAGTAFSYQVSASDADLPTTLTYYDNTSLFDIDSAGLISFTPQSADVGTHSILITVGDNSTCSNTNATDTFVLTISAAAEAAPAPSAPAAGGGGGAAPSRVKEEVVPPPAGLSFESSEEILKVTIRPSQELERRITVRNTGDVALVMKVLNPLASLLAVSPEKFTLQPGEEKEVTFLFNFNKNAEPGVYMKLIAMVGSAEGKTIARYISTVMEVESEEVIVDASLDILRKKLLPGEDIRAAVTLFNLRKGAADVTLWYLVLDSNGRIISETKETLRIDEQVSFTKTIPLPELKSGPYLLALRILALNSFASATELFVIESPLPPVLERPVTPMTIPILFMAIVILVAAVLVMTYLIWTKLQRQKALTRIVTQTSSASPQKQSGHTPLQSAYGKMTVPPPVMNRAANIDLATKIEQARRLERNRLEHKLDVLRDGFHRGFIKEKTYKKTKARIEKRLLKRK